MLHSAKRRDALEYGMGQRLLQVVAALRRNLLDLGSQEIVIPGAGRIVVLRQRNILEPNFDRDQQSLRGAHFEIVKPNVYLHSQRFE